MKLDSFLAVKPVSVSAEPPVAVATEGEQAGLPGIHPEPGSQIVTGGAEDHNLTPSVATAISYNVTPSGIKVAYQSEPKRTYWVNETEVPSVTTVLDVLKKGGLTVWGMRVGIKGVVELFERGVLESSFDWDSDRERLTLNGEYVKSPGILDGASPVELAMKEHDLTTDKVTDSASLRGSNVHDALEQWAKTGHLPSPGDFPETEVGYVTGLVAFLEDARPEPIRTEVMVGSVEHGFAGRYDLELRLNETRTIRRTPKRAYHDIPPGTYLVDFKSSKSVYPSTHFRQVAAYEAARVEGGYEPTDAQYVLNANGEGSYAFVKSTATLADFLAVLSVYKSDKLMAAKKAA